MGTQDDIINLPRWAKYIADANLLNMFRDIYANIGTTVQDETTKVYVHENGSDANSGLSTTRPVATLARALTIAAGLRLSAPRVAIVVLDAVPRNASLELPNSVDLDAPHMTLTGVENGAPTLLVGADCYVRIHGLVPNPDATPGDFVSNSAALKQAGGFSKLEVFQAWSAPGGIAVASVSNDGALHCNAGIIHVANDSFGLGGGFANDFGHLHVYAGDVYLEGNNAVGVVSGQNSTSVANVLGYIEHLIERGGPFAGTVAFAALGDIGSFGKIVMGAGTVSADTLGIETEGCLVRVLLADGRMIAGNVVSEPIYGMQPLTERGVANGYATLGADGKVPSAQLPASSVGALDYQGTWDADANSPVIPAAAVGNAGHYYVVSVAGTTEIDGISTWNLGDWIVSDGVTWSRIENTQNVLSVAGKTGAVTLVKGDVGLGNVDNVSDANKPVSTAQQAALNLKQSTSEKGASNGYASLDSSGKVPVAQLPASVVGAVTYQGTWDANTNSPTIPAAAAGNKGYYYRVSVAGATNINGVNDWKVGDWIISNGAAWEKVDNTDQVTSVAGRQGAIILTSTDVGLENCNNTSDANKPVSTATAAALRVYTNVRTPTDNATLELNDAGGLIEMNKATAVNLTVPTNASVAIPVNSVIDVAQYGAGQVTFVPADGTVTIRSSGGKLKLTGQYSGATLVKRGTNEWYLFGDIAA